MEYEKQQLRKDNLKAAKAVFNRLKTVPELRQADLHDIICFSRGWDPYRVTLSWNFNTIKKFLVDHNLAVRFTDGAAVYYKATARTLGSSTFEEAARIPSRVEKFKEKYSKQLERFEQKNSIKVEFEDLADDEPRDEFRGLQLDDEVIYYRKKTGETGEGYVSSVTTYSKNVVNQNCFSLSVSDGFIKGIGYVESEDMFLESTGDEIQIIKKKL